MRSAGKLRQANDKLIICSNSACPAIAKNDCQGWIGEIKKEIPSVVFRARRPDGNDAVDVRVTMDGEEIATKLDGRPIQVDPGPHVFRFEAEGLAPLERQIVVVVGETNRAISVKLEALAAEPPPGPPPSVEPESQSSVPTATWILGGVGVVGLAGFAGFGLSGLSKESDLESCKPNCADDKVQSAETSFLLADVSLAVGVLALGGATYFLLSSGPSATEAPKAAWRVGLAPRQAGGGTLVFDARF